MTPDDPLFRAALAARDQAHAPYSKFRVGAAVRTIAGEIFAGANIENASYPEGWCAETTAIASMVMATVPDARRIADVCVVTEAEPPGTPCGGCRQRLAEFGGPDTVIHIATPRGPASVTTLGDLLPQSFRLEAS